MTQLKGIPYKGKENHIFITTFLLLDTQVKFFVDNIGLSMNQSK